MLSGRLVKDEPVASYQYRQVSLLAPQADELLVRVCKVALCGTDTSLYLWNNGVCMGGRRTARLHVVALQIAL